MPDGVTASVGKSVLSAIRGPGTVMDGRQAHEIKVGLAVLRRAAARPGMPQKSRGCVTYRPLRCNLGALRARPREAPRGRQNSQGSEEALGVDIDFQLDVATCFGRACEPGPQVRGKIEGAW